MFMSNTYLYFTIYNSYLFCSVFFSIYVNIIHFSTLITYICLFHGFSLTQSQSLQHPVHLEDIVETINTTLIT